MKRWAMAGGKGDKQAEQAAKRARLAAALKQNLRRRKAQARDWAADAGDSEAATGGADDGATGDRTAD